MPVLETKVLQKISHEEHACKYYRLQVVKETETLFTLIQDWGRIGKAGRQVKTPYDNSETALGALDKLLNTKLKRGYELLSGETTIPSHYEAPPCPWCTAPQSGSPALVATFAHSSLYLTEDKDKGSVLYFIYRDHIPGLFHLDSASLLGFLAEIRRIQNLLNEKLPGQNWTQQFGGPDHLWCLLSLNDQVLQSLLERIQVPYPNSQFRQEIQNFVQPTQPQETGNPKAETDYPGQLSLFDALD